jgi:hypothetical protein
MTAFRREFPALRLSGASFFRTIVMAMGVAVVAVLMLRTGNGALMGLGGVMGIGALGIAISADRMRSSKVPPLVLDQETVQFRGRTVYLRDVTEIVAGGQSFNADYFPVTLKTSLGDQTFNLFEYAVAVTSADEFVNTLRDLWRAERDRATRG